MEMAQRFLAHTTLYICLIFPSLIPSQGAYASGNFCKNIFEIPNGGLTENSRPKNQEAIVQIRPRQSIPKLRFMTWNLREFRIQSKNAPGFLPLSQGLRKIKTSQQLQEHAQLILHSNSDIITVQEADRYSLDYFNQNYLGSAYHIYIPNYPQGEGVAFLVKRNLPLDIQLESRSREKKFDKLTNKISQNFTHDLPALIIRSKDSSGHFSMGAKPDFILMGVHFKSMRNRVGDPLSEKLRSEEYSGFIDIYNRYKLRFGDEIPILAAGDFNADLRTSEMIRPFWQFLTDVFDMNDVEFDDRTSHVYFDRRKSFSTPHLKQLDAILVSPELRSSVLSSSVLPLVDSNGSPKPVPKTTVALDSNSSDHFPIITEISTYYLWGNRDGKPKIPKPDEDSKIPNEKQFPQARVGIFSKKKPLVSQNFDGKQLREDLDFLEELTDFRLKERFGFQSINEPYLQIPVKAASYQNTKFEIQKSPKSPVDSDQRLVENAYFGYVSGGEFRKIGLINYLVISSTDEVLEVGLGNSENRKDAELLKQVFREQIFGRTLSAEDRRQIINLNTAYFEKLRAHPKCKEKLKEFVQERHWRPQWAEEAQLAYFDGTSVNPFDWAREHKYSYRQMADAGWLSLRFTDEGTVKYQIPQRFSIKIPSFTDSSQAKVSSFRSRMLEIKRATPTTESRPSDESSISLSQGLVSPHSTGRPQKPLAKYKGQFKDRSLTDPSALTNEMYLSWMLENQNLVKNKRIVITEGEFKSMVATKMTGILTLGILGIGNFTRQLAKLVVQADPSEIIIVLDRDTKSADLIRIDGISDSKRMAYAIAQELQHAGARDVKIGILPDVLNGEKVGVDDLLLTKGVGPYLEVLNSALAPEFYAKKLGMDEPLQKLFLKVRDISLVWNRYNRSARRKDDETIPPNLDKIIKRVGTEYAAAESELLRYLNTHYDGATSVSHPYFKIPKIEPINYPKSPALEPAQHETILTRSNHLEIRSGTGEIVPVDRFDRSVLLMDFVPMDLPKDLCIPGPCLELGFKWSDILAFKKALESRLAQSSDLDKGDRNEVHLQLEKYFEQGLSAIAKMEPSKSKPESFDFEQTLLIGYLSSVYPMAEYEYKLDLQVVTSGQKAENSSCDTRFLIPISIFKISKGNPYGPAVAVARLRFDPKKESYPLPQLFDLFRKALRH